MTPKQAAAQLGLSVKNLMEHVAAGNIAYVNIGTKTRKIHRFTATAPHAFMASQTVKEDPKCLSLKGPALKHTAMSSKPGAVDFLAIPKLGPKKKPTP
jgi:hypothetical protein